MKRSAGEIAMSLAAAPTRRPARFTATATADWAEIAAGWVANQPAEPATMFQSSDWLGSFYRALAARGGAEPLIVSIVDADSGEMAMRLPLLRRRHRSLATIEFADLDLTDYNAPLLGPAAPTTREGAQAAMRALKAAVGRADLLRFVKMPPVIAGRPNPLALLPQARTSSLFGQPLVIGADFTAWRFSFHRTFRKELERSWRVFTRDPDAAFRRITDPAEGLAILAKMEAQQRERMAATGKAYHLEEPLPAAFYRDLIRTGLANGYAVLTVLTAGDELVAGMLSARNAGAMVVIRLTHAGAGWAQASPARLLLNRTMEHMHGEDGCRVFDFSIGEYEYKRRFGVGHAPLADLTLALSPLALPAMLRARSAAALRARPELDRRLRAVLARLRPR